MNLDLTECKARRDWASKHLMALRSTVRDYEQSQPYVLQHDFDQQACESRIYIAPRPAPLEISFMADDIAHNLRSTLDHLIWQLTIAHGNASPPFPLPDDATGRKWRDIEFPLQTKPVDLESWSPKGLWGISDDWRAFLMELQPFAADAGEPRNSTLWKLRELSNTDKHRVSLIAVPALTGTGTFRMNVPKGVSGQFDDIIPVPTMLEGEMLVCTMRYDREPSLRPFAEIEYRVEVAFHNSIGIGTCLNVVDLLGAMEGMVTSTLQRAERLAAAAPSDV
jgi:hypothetical protein